MKKELKVNKDFILEYFGRCSLLVDTDWMENWNRHMRVILKGHSSDSIFGDFSLEYAQEFCTKFKINKNRIDDFAMIFYIIDETKYERGFYDDGSASYYNDYEIGFKKLQEIADKFYKGAENSNFFSWTEGEVYSNVYQEIKFVGKKNADSLSIKNFKLINSVFSMIKFGMDEYKSTRLKNNLKDSKPRPYKHPRTHDLKVFSWGILNYLNKFTQIKAGKTLATNEQCRIIYDILLGFGLIYKNEMDKVDQAKYIRAYLNQASKEFSK